MHLTKVLLQKRGHAPLKEFLLSSYPIGSTLQLLANPDDAPSTSHYTFDANGNILGFFGEIFQKGRESEDGGGGRFERNTLARNGRHGAWKIAKAGALERVANEPNG